MKSRIGGSVSRPNAYIPLVAGNVALDDSPPACRPESWRRQTDEHSATSEVIWEAGTAEIEAAAPQYDANTTQALERGVFGAPFYIVGDERFWGQDRLDMLDWYLEQHPD